MGIGHHHALHGVVHHRGGQALAGLLRCSAARGLDLVEVLDHTHQVRVAHRPLRAPASRCTARAPGVRCPAAGVALVPRGGRFAYQAARQLATRPSPGPGRSSHARKLRLSVCTGSAPSRSLAGRCWPIRICHPAPARAKPAGAWRTICVGLGAMAMRTLARACAAAATRPGQARQLVSAK